MDKRLARRLAAAAVFTVPGAISAISSASAEPVILTPRANTTVGGKNVTIFAQFSSPRPVAAVRLFVDNLPISTQHFGPASLNGTLNIVWDSTVAATGNHKLTIKTYDRSGRLIGQQAVPVSIDNGSATDTVAPQVTILSPDANAEVQGAIDVKLLASDNSGEAPYVSLFVDKQLKGVSNREPYDFSLDTSRYANGKHTLEAWAYDANENRGIANTVSIRVNNPGGATTLNEDVNRMGAAPGAAAQPDATAVPLPVIAAPRPIHSTEGITAIASAPASPVQHVVEAIHVPAMKPKVSARVSPPKMVMPRVEPLQPAAQPFAIDEIHAPDAKLPVAKPAANTVITDLEDANDARIAPAHFDRTTLPTPLKTRIEARPRARAGAVKPVLIARATPIERPTPVLEKPAADVHATESVTPRAQVVRANVRPVAVKPRVVAMAKAAAKPVKASAVKPPVMPVLVADNAAVRPAHLAHPTALIIHVARPVHAAAHHAAPPQRVAEGLKPAFVKELGDDRVEGSHIVHAVRPGESAKSLAASYGVPLKRLLATNHIGRRDRLAVGDDVLIPSPVRVAFNDEPVHFDVAPRVADGVTLAPLRQICESAGGTLTWDAARREVRMVGSDVRFVLRVGSRVAYVNGRPITLDAVTTIDSGRTIVPVRFLAEALHLKAEYDLRSGAINLRHA